MYSKQRQQFQIENVPWKRNEAPLKNNNRSKKINIQVKQTIQKNTEF